MLLQTKKLEIITNSSWYDGGCTGQSGQWLGYELDDRGSIPGKGKDFFVFATASRHWGPPNLLSKENRGGGGGPSSWVERPGRQADHSPPSSAEVKKVWSYTSTLPILLNGVVL